MGRYIKKSSGSLQGRQDKGRWKMGEIVDDTQARRFAQLLEREEPAYPYAEKNPISRYDQPL